MNEGRNPLVLLIVNFIVGYLVAKGFIEPSDHNLVVDQISQLVGLTIIGATTLISLHKVLSHTNSLSKQMDPTLNQPASQTTQQINTESATIINPPAAPSTPPQVVSEIPADLQTQTGTPPVGDTSTPMGQND
jgi:hypothetical protein